MAETRRNSFLGVLGRWATGRAAESVVDAPSAGKFQGRRNSGFAAARYDRLTEDWGITPAALDVYLRHGLRGLRARSRQLAINNDYMRSFLRMVRRNVIGPAGMTLQVLAEDAPGRLDKKANDEIERAWLEFTKFGTPTVCGRYSFQDLERLVVFMLARDGEVLLRRVRGYPNKFGYALQLLSIDQLDENLSLVGRDGAEVRMGVEVDVFGKVRAYHILKNNPADLVTYGQAQESVRVAAEDVIHLFIEDDAGQTRGFPWGASSMRRLNMLGGFEEAALVNARVGASKMGFFVAKSDGDPMGQPQGQRDPATGTMLQDADPGTFETLPDGYEFQEFNPKYPDGEMAPFVKGMLRGAASGLGVSYNGIANDLEGVNYSSMRVGAIEERAEWKMIQAVVRDRFHSVIFGDWLSQSIISGAIALPFSKLAKFKADHWQARGWDWVNPKDDMEANEKAIALGLTSRTRLAAAKGDDFEQIMIEQKKDQEIAARYGVKLADPSQPKAAAAAAPGGLDDADNGKD